MTNRQVLLVAGAGRRGPALLGGMLAQLGYRVPGAEARTTPGQPIHSGSSRWVAEVHQRLLGDAAVAVADGRPAASLLASRAAGDDAVRRTVRSRLADELGAHEHVVIADPAALWFVPLWEALAEELGAEIAFVVVLRSAPDIVAAGDHHGGPVPAVVAGWLNTMLLVERATRTRRRALVHLADVLDDWAAVVTRLDDTIGLAPIRGAIARDFVRVETMVAAGGDATASWDDAEIDDRMRALADRVAVALGELALHDPYLPAAVAALDALRSEYRAYYELAERVVASSLQAARRPGGSLHEPTPTASETRALRLARLVPPSVRHRLPLARRQALLRRLS